MHEQDRRNDPDQSVPEAPDAPRRRGLPPGRAGVLAAALAIAGGPWAWPGGRGPIRARDQEPEWLQEEKRRKAQAKRLRKGQGRNRC